MALRTSTRAGWRVAAAILLLPAAAAATDSGPPVRFYADLSAAEESTTTVSNGSGRAEFSLDRATLRFSWRASFGHLSSAVAGAAVHGPQRPGTNAGVQLDMAAKGVRPPLQGSVVLTDAQLQYLLAGRMYVNIRTRKYPDGELRGQIQRWNQHTPVVEPIRPSGATAAPVSVSATAVEPMRSGATTLGFVVANFNNAIYETQFMDECPDGPAIGNDEFWWRGLSRSDKDKLTKNGLVQPVDRRPIAALRGPKGEDVCTNPTIVKDPPLRTVQGKVSYGFNLDSESAGKATPKSCAHQNFSSETGEPGVDNQMYRLLGCYYGWRHNGVLDTFGNEERRNSGRGVILMEVTGVTDPRNSPDVRVAFYRAVDPFSIDAAGHILPYASYRVDINAGKPRYGATARGRIVNGVLRTEPIDAKLPFYANSAFAEIQLRDMRVSMNLTPNAMGMVNGLLGGYYDFDKWWEYMNKVEFLAATGDWSCPALYTAAKQLADGYPDPKTGECTAISAAFKLEALPAFVIHPPAVESVQ